MLKRRAAAATMIAVFAGLAACGGGSGGSEPVGSSPVTVPAQVTAPGGAATTAASRVAPQTPPPPATDPAATAPPTGDTTPPAPVVPFPLTGLPVTDANLNLRPALAIKINNHRDARPHAGLNQADIVYEEIVEGITRFMAVYHSQDVGPVGPIRSARTTDVDLLNQLNRPLFAWSGGNRGVVNAISQANAESRAHGQVAGYYRDPDRQARYATEHTLFHEGTQLLYTTAGLNQGLPTPFFAYRAPGEEAAGQPAGSIIAKLASTPLTWTWDPARGLWIRTEYGDPHVDTTGADVSAENVIIQFCEYRRSAADPGSPEAVTVGSGDVWVFSGGKVVEGRWDRPDPAKPATLTDTAGNPIRLTAGRTWIELAEVGKTVVDWA